jgi:Dynamin central region
MIALSSSQMYLPDMDCPDIMTVADVEKTIASTKGRVLPLPGRPEYDTSELIMRAAVNRWKAPSIECVEKVHDMLRTLVSGENGLIDEAVTKRFQKITNIYVEITDDMLRERCSLIIQRVTECWEMEQQLYTSNDTHLQFVRSQFIARIKNAIEPEGTIADLVNHLESLGGCNGMVLEQLAKFGITQESIAITRSTRICSDRVIETIANAMAYFHLKAASYADIVSTHILFHLLEHFNHDLGHELNKRIGVFTKTDDELHILFSEGADVSKRREELQRRRERQLEALNLMNGHINYCA